MSDDTLSGKGDADGFIKSFGEIGDNDCSAGAMWLLGPLLRVRLHGVECCLHSWQVPYSSYGTGRHLRFRTLMWSQWGFFAECYGESGAEVWITDNSDTHSTLHVSLTCFPSTDNHYPRFRCWLNEEGKKGLRRKWGVIGFISARPNSAGFSW